MKTGGKRATISEYFSAAADRYPDRAAVTDESGREYTYRELDAKSSAVARMLQARDVLPGSSVAIQMDRSSDAVAAMLGILKAGCTYMFVDRNYPIERIRFMIRDAEARLVICDTIPENTAEREENIILFEEICDQFPGGGPVTKRDDPDTGAYIIYTSGSTGKPKGLKVSNRNFISLYECWGREHLLLPGRKIVRTAVIAPFAFDMCVLMIFGSLLSGAHLHILSERTKQSGEGILHFLDRYHIDIMDATPNYLRMIDDALQNPEGMPFRLKRLFCIGDVLNYQLARNLINASEDPDFELYNTYGPAECTILMTSFRMNRENADLFREFPIGTVTENADVRIVDESGADVPEGETGELVILGPCVGLGYFSRHAQNNDAFRRFGPGTYRTGDLVRRDGDGVLHFIGRVDRQCKINGYRVELEEIERCTENMPGIREARAVVKREDDGFVRLLLFYTGHMRKDVRTVLRKKLPYYAVPENVLYCEEFPVSPNGKVDYRALISLAEQAEKEENPGRFLLGEIRRLTDCEEADQSDSFFEIGGNSIMLLSLASSLSEKFHIHAQLSHLFLAETIGEMMDYAESLRREEAAGRKDETRSFCVLEQAKRLMAFEHRLARSDKSLAYSLIYRISFRHPIDGDRMNRCIGKVVRENEIFRVRITRAGNRWRYEKTETSPEIRIRRGTDERRVQKELRYFSVDSSPFMEFVQYGENVLYLNIKHVYMDFISVQYLLKDITALYECGTVPPVRTGFLEYLGSNNFSGKAQLSFWKNKLTGVTEKTILPGDLHGHSSQKFVKIDCGHPFYEMIREKAREHHSSLFIQMLTAFVRTLCEYTGKDRLIIGCYCPGRNSALDHGMMGMMTSVLPLVLDAKDREHLEDTVRKETLLLLQNQNVSQSRLFQLAPFDLISDGEMFDICFNYQNDWMCIEESGEIESIESRNILPDVTEKGLYFGIVEENRELKLEIGYDHGKYSELYIRQFAERVKDHCYGMQDKTDAVLVS
ncbi:MAG: amino acid adenylation domain-containing protein [Bilifractor sp.]|jgi:amino acid adenylation domain-containing protein